jgi:hypothetical protein
VAEIREHRLDDPQWSMSQNTVLHAPSLSSFHLLGRSDAHFADLPCCRPGLGILSLVTDGSEADDSQLFVYLEYFPFARNLKILACVVLCMRTVSPHDVAVQP